MSLLDTINRLLGHTAPAVQRHREDLLSTLLIMAWMVEARDPYTGGHLWRVSRMARLVAQSAGLPDADVARITVGGFLHDLGKISIPDHILGKKDRLTDDEYAIIKTHPDVGWRMLASHPLAKLAEAAVRAHHETPDGRGYPRGLSGESIPVDARIVGVCDAFDAMTSTRPYRRGMPVPKALGIISEALGRQFDAPFSQHLIALGQAGELDHIVGHSDDGIPLHVCGMCGPTLVRTRATRPGHRLYCRVCSGEYLVESEGNTLVTRATGATGTPANLEPEADTALIANVVRESARALLQT
jgi:HD domain